MVSTEHVKAAMDLGVQESEHFITDGDQSDADPEGHGAGAALDFHRGAPDPMEDLGSYGNEDV